MDIEQKSIDQRITEFCDLLEKSSSEERRRMCQENPDGILDNCDSQGEYPAHYIAKSLKNIDCFKPDPKAVFYILKKLGINKPEDCLFVGDRYDKDQACADNARIVSLIIK